MNDNVLKNEYLTVSDIGRYLNISLSKSYELVHRKDFPVCRFGGSIRVPKGAFLNWVAKHTKVPTELTA